MQRIKLVHSLRETSLFFIWPALTALVLCVPYLVILIISNGYSPSLYQDADEPFYLAVLQFVSKYSIVELIRLFPETPSDFPLLPVFYSHSVVDLFLGTLLYVTGIHGVNFLHILDWIFVFCAFIGYRFVFTKFSAIPLVANAAAAIAIAYPYVLNIGQNILPASFINLGLSSLRESFLSLPAMRGIYTQVSLFPFLYCLGLFLEQTIGAKGNTKKYFLLGCFTGFLVYLYSFAWIVIIALSAVVSIVTSRFLKKELDFKNLLVYFSGSLLIAGPGVLLTAGTRAAFGMQKGVGAPSLPWLPLDYIFFITVVYTVFRRLVVERRNEWSMLFISVLISELVLHNLEFLTNQIWVPYHFSLFYFRPILVGLLVVPLVQLLIRTRGVSITKFVLFGVYFSAFFINSTECLYNYRAGKELESMLRDLSNRESIMTLGSNHFPLDDDYISGFAVLPLFVSNVTPHLTYFGETVFREMFGAKPTGFPLLRTALVNGGYPYTFCDRIDAIASVHRVDSMLLNWIAITIQSQCRQLPQQLLALCALDDWNMWYPNQMLLEESDYQKRLLAKKAVLPVLELTEQKKYHIISLTADSEKAEVCKNIN